MTQQTTVSAPFDMSNDEWRKALSKLARKLRQARKTSYQGIDENVPHSQSTSNCC